MNVRASEFLAGKRDLSLSQILKTIVLIERQIIPRHDFSLFIALIQCC